MIIMSTCDWVRAMCRLATHAKRHGRRLKMPNGWLTRAVLAVDAEREWQQQQPEEGEES